jgi:hypothetical protein
VILLLLLITIMMIMMIIVIVIIIGVEYQREEKVWDIGKMWSMSNSGGGIGSSNRGRSAIPI